MEELATPLGKVQRHAQTLAAIEVLAAHRQQVELQFRTLLNKLAVEDTPAEFLGYNADSLALLLSESPRTTQRWLTDAQIFWDCPAVAAKVADQTWTVRQGDAVIDEILVLSAPDRDAAVELIATRVDVRTPYQLRQAARAAVTMLDLDAAQKRADKAKADRHYTTVDNRDGSATGLLTGPKALLAQVSACLDAMCLPARPGDTRTLAQRRFDTLLDLVCGRVQPGQWQAQVLVTLATLEGGGDDRAEPAEIPGLGLITATEARELLAQAGLRRVVVDEHGQLVSVDSPTHQPDLDPTTPEADTLTDQVEPTLELEPTEPPVDPADQSWALQAQHEAYLARAWDAFLADVLSHVDDHLDEREQDLGFEAELCELLDQHALVPAGPRYLQAEDCYPLEDTYETFTRPDRRGGNGPSGDWWPDPPPEPPDQPGTLPPEPDPPTPADLDWDETSPARQLQHQQLDHLAARNGSLPTDNPRSPRSTSPAAPRSAWSPTALLRALTTLRTRPADPAPTASSSYPFTGRLARHIKTRDQTCSFPGCQLLAQHCQSDHITPWPAGPTDHSNAASECVHHHQAKHAYFTVTRHPNGTLTWTDPHGSSQTRHPRSLLPGH